MTKGSTHFLRGAIAIMAGVALFLCCLVLPVVYEEWPGEYPDAPYLGYVLVVVLVLTTVPFFIALYHTLRILSFIDKNKAFTPRVVRSLEIIKYCAGVFSALYLVIMPIVYYLGEREDAPGLIVMGTVMVFAPLTIAVFMAVLQKLFQSAIDIKNENDLTV